MLERSFVGVCVCVFVNAALDLNENDCDRKWIKNVPIMFLRFVTKKGHKKSSESQLRRP